MMHKFKPGDIIKAVHRLSEEPDHYYLVESITTFKSVSGEQSYDYALLNLMTGTRETTGIIFMDKYYEQAA